MQNAIMQMHVHAMQMHANAKCNYAKNESTIKIIYKGPKN